MYRWSEQAALAIMDRGKKVAVIVGYKQFQILISILKQQVKWSGKHPLAGLITKAGDLDKSKAKVNKLFQESFKKTAKSILDALNTSAHFNKSVDLPFGC